MVNHDIRYFYSGVIAMQHYSISMYPLAIPPQLPSRHPIPRTNLLHYFPKRFRVIHFNQMRQLMRDDVVDQVQRQLDQAPV